MSDVNLSPVIITGSLSGPDDVDPESADRRAPGSAAAAHGSVQAAIEQSAVDALVKSQSSRASAPQPFVASGTTLASLLDAAPRCAGEIDGVALLLLGSATGPGAVLGGFKAGFDLGKCVAERENERGEREAAVYCESIGGTPLGSVEHVTTCAVERRTP